MAVEALPIFAYYDKQRFIQAGCMDCANWHGLKGDGVKNVQALYPSPGRKHVEFLNKNRLIFDSEPRALYKTINFMYVIDGNQVKQVDKFYNEKIIGNVSLTGEIWFSFLAVESVVYGMLTDESNIYVITENGSTITYQMVTDSNAPTSPQFVATFGDRFVVSQKDSPIYYLSTVDLAGTAADWFTIDGAPLVARATSVIKQLGVLHAQLFIFNDFGTDIWANIPTQVTVGGSTRLFPFKLNTSFNFDYGIADPRSLNIDFGRMVWLAQNSNGLVTFMVSNGGQPEAISTTAINVLLQKSSSSRELSPFLQGDINGFLYQYENTIFYRVSANTKLDFSHAELQDSANSIEFNFDTGTWIRCIELDGERCRIQKHVFFNNTHFVSLEDDKAVYEMAGNIYFNETLNPDQPDHQADDAFIKYPMRYELTTKQIFEPDYSEFVDKYVEIDFVFGEQTFYKSDAPFDNTVFIVDENSTPDNPIYLLTEDGAFIIAEEGNTPTFNDNHYNALFKPHIELYYTNDGAITFESADLREFSQLGQYRWRMRWYQLGPSRNRAYRLVCVSSAPIVILGGVRNTTRSSGGAN